MKKQITIYLVVLGALFVLLIPRENRELNSLVLDLHRASLSIESALYSYGSNKIPVRDIFSQYGSAQGYAGSKLLAPSVARTIDNFNWFNVSVKIIFLFFLFVFLLKLFKSYYFAVATLGLVFFTQFIVYGKMEHSLLAPSIGAYRYPFAPIILIFLMELCLKPKSWLFLSLVSVFSGLQAFWIYDAGLGIFISTFSVLLIFLELSLIQRLTRSIFFAAV